MSQIRGMANKLTEPAQLFAQTFTWPRLSMPTKVQSVSKQTHEAYCDLLSDVAEKLNEGAFFKPSIWDAHT